MSEERKMKILVPTGVGAIFLVTVMLTVFLIDNYSAEIISLFMQMLFAVFLWHHILWALLY